VSALITEELEKEVDKEDFVMAESLGPSDQTKLGKIFSGKGQ